MKKPFYVRLTRCLTENVFEYPELINPYCLLHPKLISTTVTEIETKEVEYSVVADMIKDFTVRNLSPYENEHKIFQKDRKVEYNDCYIVKIESLTFEIIRN